MIGRSLARCKKLLEGTIDDFFLGSTFTVSELLNQGDKAPIDVKTSSSGSRSQPCSEAFA